VVTESSTSDDSDYQRFLPGVKKDKRRWKLKGSAKSYTKKAFQTYVEETKLENLIKK
jgi:hypothetical protein